MALDNEFHQVAHVDEDFKGVVFDERLFRVRLPNPNRLGDMFLSDPGWRTCRNPITARRLRGPIYLDGEVRTLPPERPHEDEPVANLNAAGWNDPLSIDPRFHTVTNAQDNEKVEIESGLLAAARLVLREGP